VSYAVDVERKPASVAQIIPSESLMKKASESTPHTPRHRRVRVLWLPSWQTVGLTRESLRTAEQRARAVVAYVRSREHAYFMRVPSLSVDISRRKELMTS
jgi:hypothetical protein